MTRNDDNPGKISIIIPTLNEAGGIRGLLKSLAELRHRGHELIVVDGGSEDDTVAIAALHTDRLITSPPGRGTQLLHGARLATGDILLFLHADTLLPLDADQLIKDVLSDRQRVWGRFDCRLAGTHPMLRIIGFMMNLRSRMTGIATGDQAIFMLRSAYLETGGFPELPLMEDIWISSRLKRQSAPACINAPVVTSGRRWEKKGILRTILLMWFLRCAFSLGADPKRLARIYRK